MRAVIVAGGPMPQPPLPELHVGEDDLVVCVDGGARNALAFGLQPHVVLGDLDSMEPELRQHLDQEGVQFVAYPARKDETDSELAVKYALDRGATDLVLLGALGGRIDHTLANVMLLAIPQLQGVRARMIDGRQELILIREEAVIEGRPGDVVSLLPLAGDAAGIHTEGLEYALHGETLTFGAARGVSNVLVAPRARVRVGAGLLLLVHHHQAPGEESGVDMQGGYHD
ncbi:MAG TPA: thiamine diphosphokinase [Anaerolineae bacterium]|nr:thiamine diphosphokinase [Anaerolineae bacterium]